MTDIHIANIRQKDLTNIRHFATEGMHLDRYVGNKIELSIYSRLATYEAYDQANIALGAYHNDTLLGFIFVRLLDESCHRLNRFQKLYVKTINKIISMSSYEGTADNYDQANKQMYDLYASQKPNAEISFFAVDPKNTGQHIGSRLLTQIEKLLPGKLIYLYTDSGCNYPFYFKRGFDAFATRDIKLPPNGLSLTCFLLSKRIKSTEH